MSVSIDVEYEGDLRSRAVHAATGATLCTVVPEEGEPCECFSPTDLLAVSLATCLITVIATTARKHGLDPKGARVHLQKTMTRSGPRRIEALDAVIDMPPGVPSELRKRLERAAHSCPIHRSLDADVRQELRFNWAD